MRRSHVLSFGSMKEAGDQRGIFLARVTERRSLCREHFQITFAVDSFPEAQPGQFVQVLCRPAGDSVNSDNFQQFVAPLLRRPFSIAGLRHSCSIAEVDLIGRVIGPGTAWLAALSPGDAVDILGPLGRSFTFASLDTRCVLVAGGVGLPPIRWLGEILSKMGRSCVAFYGVQTRELLPVTINSEPGRDGVPTMCVEEFAREKIATGITTDDGSCGKRGRVTDALREYLARESESRVQVYACGPEPMLRAVATLCAERAIPCEVAMERVMGCGMGTCQSCVVPVSDDSRPDGWRYALCCTEGPTFDADRVRWRSTNKDRLH